LGSARKSEAVAAETPPVGQNVTSGNGPANALSMPMPPACCAGNSFSSLKPAARAAITSDGVITPGSNGNALSLAADARAGVSPGLTPNTAPALIELIEVLGPGDRTDTDDRALDLTRDGLDGLQSDGGTQREFEHPHATRNERSCERHGMLDLLDDDDRNDRADAHDL
jgi:hypothetical protein